MRGCTSPIRGAMVAHYGRAFTSAHFYKLYGGPPKYSDMNIFQVGARHSTRQDRSLGRGYGRAGMDPAWWQ
jgi:hypothetical protein